MSVKHFDTQEYAKKKSISIEMAARELSYDWFEEMRQKKKMDYIVVGHHADDLAETLFINICRGTGIKGSPVSVLSKIVFYARSCPVPGRRSLLTSSKTNWGIAPTPPTTRSTTYGTKFAT